MCGNSANFQGDERDVIFLSVVDSGDGTGPIHMQNFGADDAYRKRYNVATSRARDQLWVVHSLDAVNDLKPGDIRKILIDYANNPQTDNFKHAEVEEESESPFEASVASSLVSRGYHLVQQWKVGAYRLDMVAVYGKKKVAIECDGERWHSGEAKIREDMERQTILERLGWRFIRVRGSEYYRNPDDAMSRIINQLQAYGIEVEQSESISDESRNTELLERVKSRAAIILYGNDNNDEPDYATIATALNANQDITMLEKNEDADSLISNDLEIDHNTQNEDAPATASGNQDNTVSTKSYLPLAPIQESVKVKRMIFAKKNSQFN